MLFNSLHFAAFFPVVVLAYFAIPLRFRWTLLLAASYYFYMCWKVEYVLLILLSTCVDYAAARAMGRRPDRRSRRPFLWMSLVANLGLLFAFKYLEFASENLENALAAFDIFVDVPLFDALLPVGISFYTFQTLSYTIDVYRGKLEPERHFGYFALYVAFWPQLVAGPIERPGRLLPQLRTYRPFDPDRVRTGLALMIWGFFKKLVIADRLAAYVDAVYAGQSLAGPEPGGGAVLLATYLFAFQIYCDFSGYSDIAIGASRVMGIDLMTNFRRPYFATSISDFWGRWHISLSTWFRDYVYVPLGGNRVARSRHFANLLITFLVSGLWHGASWTFVIWGGLHGAYLVLSILLRPWRARAAERIGLGRWPGLVTFAQRLWVFQLVAVGWIFFRAGSLGEAIDFLRRIVASPLDLSGMPLPFGPMDFWVALGSIVLLLALEVWKGDRRLDSKLFRGSKAQRRLFYVAMTLLLLWFGVFTSKQFIYFQF